MTLRTTKFVVDPRHLGSRTTHFTAATVQALALPLLTGFAAFGWRAAVVVLTVVACCVFATWIWRRAAAGAIWPGLGDATIAALLLAAMLPAHWAGGTLQTAGRRFALWPLLPAAGLGVAGLLIVRERFRTTLFDPVSLTLISLVAIAGIAMTPTAVLPLAGAFRGDVLSSSAHTSRTALDTIFAFTSGRFDGEYLTLDALLRDRLPPLEHILLARQPAAIGVASPIAVLVGGLLLCYRGAARWRIVLLTLASAYLTFLLLPLPLVVSDQSARPVYLSTLLRIVGLGTTLTMVHYELLGGLLPFAAVFLATRRELCPLYGWPQRVYAVLIGVFAAAMQRYISPLAAAPAAVLIVAVLVSPLERHWAPRSRL